MFGLFRIAAAVPEIRVAAPDFNAAKTAELFAMAAQEGCAAVLFPELGISGSSCGDLFFSRDLQQRCLEALRKIVAASRDSGTVGIAGLPLAAGGALFNAAAVFQNGRVLGFAGKSIMQSERHFRKVQEAAERQVFFDGRSYTVEEKALFRSGNGFCFGVVIGSERYEATLLSGALTEAGAQIIFNPYATPEIAGASAVRRQEIAVHSAGLVSGYVSCGAGVTESTSDAVYAGDALAASCGRILCENRRFCRSSSIIYADIDTEEIMQLRMHRQTPRIFSGCGEAAVTVALDNVPECSDGKYLKLSANPFVPENADELAGKCAEILQIQSSALAKRIEHTGAKKLVLGLSGGLDSTLAAIVCAGSCKLLGRSAADVIAVTMPGFGTGSRTRGNAEKLAELLGMTLRTIPIGAAVKQHFSDIGHDGVTPDAAYENSQARERTQILMDLANSEYGFVVGTGDLSEAALGWCTFNGDHMSMYNVNASVPKTLVRHIAEFYAEQSGGELKKVLLDINATPVSPELLPPDASGNIAQKTENIIGSYELHDFFLYHFVKSGFALAKLRFLANIVFAGRFSAPEIDYALGVFAKRFITQQFKRSASPEGIKTGEISLSPRGDWQMPADAECEVFKLT